MEVKAYDEIVEEGRTDRRFALSDVTHTDLSTIVYALCEYRDRLLDDMATQYRGKRHLQSAPYSIEDEVFLAEQLYRTLTVLHWILDTDPIDYKGGTAPRYRKMTFEELRDDVPQKLTDWENRNKKQ